MCVGRGEFPKGFSAHLIAHFNMRNDFDLFSYMFILISGLFVYLLEKNVQNFDRSIKEASLTNMEDTQDQYGKSNGD